MSFRQSCQWILAKICAPETLPEIAPPCYRFTAMQITWHGFSCFRITETLNGHEVSVVIDPFESQDGFKLPRNLSADTVISSHPHSRHNNISAVSGVGDAKP